MSNHQGKTKSYRTTTNQRAFRMKTITAKVTPEQEREQLRQKIRDTKLKLDKLNKKLGKVEKAIKTERRSEIEGTSEGFKMEIIDELEEIILTHGCTYGYISQTLCAKIKHLLSIHKEGKIALIPGHREYYESII